MTISERELSIDASAAVRAEKFDDGRPYPAGWKRVDYLIDLGNRVLMLEIKDPADSMVGASETKRNQQRRNFLERLESKTLISQALAPKALHTYLYQHLMASDGKPFVFVALIGLDGLDFDRALLGPLQSALESELRKACGVVWRRQFVKGCIVATDTNWNKLFPDLPLKRTRPPKS